MKNKLSYLFGVVFLLSCTTGTLTSCLEVDTSIDTAASGGGLEDDHLPKIGGSYFEDEDGDNELYMTCNGKTMRGKKVSITPDEKNETAIITLEGAEVDLSSLFNGLAELRFTTNSPIPGVKKLRFRDIPLTLLADGKTYSFEGSYEQADGTFDDYKMSYKGTVKEGEMRIDVQYTLKGKELLGTWDLDAAYRTDQSAKAHLGLGAKLDPSGDGLSPLWMDWKTDEKVKIGVINDFVEVPLIGNNDINETPNNLLGIVSCTEITDALKGKNPATNIEEFITNMLKSVIPDSNGSMYFMYSYSGNMFNPAPTDWSKGKEDDTSNNIVRYYYGKQKIKREVDGKEVMPVRLEINPYFLMNSLGGLLGGISTRTATPAADARMLASRSIGTRDANPENSKELARQLVDKLKPALENGIECEYDISHSDNKSFISININGTYLRDLLKIIASLLNDEIVNTSVKDFLRSDPSIKTYAPMIERIIEALPRLLGEDPKKPCHYVRLGFRMHRNPVVEPEPEEPVVPEPEPGPENPDIQK